MRHPTDFALPVLADPPGALALRGNARAWRKCRSTWAAAREQGALAHGPLRGRIIGKLTAMVAR